MAGFEVGKGRAIRVGMNDTQSKVAMLQTRRQELRQDMQGAEWADRQTIAKELKMIDKALRYLQS
jgi:hypothetical protein